MGCQRKHPLHTSLGSLLLSCGILLSSVGWIQLHKSHRRPSFIVQCAWFQAATQLSWLPVLISVAPPSLRRKASTGIMLQIIEAHPNWPVYADVFKHHLHGLHLDAQYGQTQLCRHNYAAERGLVVGFCGHWSTTLLLPTLLTDSQVLISLVMHGLWWTISGQVKAHVVLTCTNGVSSSHLPVIVASDRPWTTLLTCAH